ncbi:Acetyl-coenzyme A carboxylase carboxyl transferase subunit beta, chloroplastic [Capsicum annuum]|nr:Acetyl-coenzyme A carboxylase carboxyl transferase subunit beta, chloroplastic [Capsicum annuum]
MNICEQCGYHLKMSSSDRIELLVDPGTWDPIDEDMVSLDPIEFHSEEEPYKDRIDSYQRKTGLTEVVQTGIGQINGILVAIGVMDFQFMRGNMGSIVGEKITCLIEHADNQILPLIIVCASGGPRMQEGSLSLMQMAKILSALYDYQLNKKLFYVSILTSPKTGGVTANFGMLGDIIIAEPNAYIAFADIQSVRIEVKEGIYARRVLYMDIRGQGYSKQNRTNKKGGYEITITDASERRQVVDIIPPRPELLVFEGESIKFYQPLTSNPNVGGFGQGDAEIVLQDPLRVQGLLFFLASVILAQIFLVLKKKQFEKVQLAEINF